MFLRYNELRALIGDQEAFDARALVGDRKAERERAYGFRPPAWIGTATQSQLEFPYLVNWGFPEKFHRKQGESPTSSRASAARRAWSRAWRGSCSARTSSTMFAPVTSWSAT